jgi:hypothetical protein
VVDWESVVEAVALSADTAAMVPASPAVTAAAETATPIVTRRTTETARLRAAMRA